MRNYIHVIIALALTIACGRNAIAMQSESNDLVQDPSTGVQLVVRPISGRVLTQDAVGRSYNLHSGSATGNVSTTHKTVCFRFHNGMTLNEVNRYTVGGWDCNGYAANTTYYVTDGDTTKTHAVMQSRDTIAVDVKSTEVNTAGTTSYDVAYIWRNSSSTPVRTDGVLPEYTTITTTYTVSADGTVHFGSQVQPCTNITMYEINIGDMNSGSTKTRSDTLTMTCQQTVSARITLTGMRTDGDLTIAEDNHALAQIQMQGCPTPDQGCVVTGTTLSTTLETTVTAREVAGGYMFSFVLSWIYD